MASDEPVVGKYRLLRPLGQGSMGEVWAASQESLGREVAIKLIYEGSPELASRLKREALACGRLEHPNIVRVYDFGETDTGDPYLVMELLAGETLADRLAREVRLPPEGAVSIALEVARALCAAHEAGIVHRDLKPANVFLVSGVKGAEGARVKVLDFGVSKILTDFDRSVTTAGALVGSPAYMSPEQARALPEIDARADLWTMGVLLFEMLTGTRPFTATTVMKVVTEILSGPIPTLASALPGIDPRLDAVVRRCLTREVDQRMASAATLVDMLTPILASLRAGETRARASLVEEMPTVAEGVVEDVASTIPKVVAPRTEEEEDEDEATVAIAYRATPDPPTEDEGQGATRVMPSRSSHAAMAPPQAPAGRLHRVRLGGPGAPEATLRLPEPEEERTRIKTRRGPEKPDATAETRLMPLPGAPSAPTFGQGFDTAPTLPRTPPLPYVALPSSDAAPPTPRPDELARRNNAQTLWMTAIAGLVLGLVVFAGLSLLR